MPENRRKQKAPKSAWKKGTSGNPGGRPKIAPEVTALARKHIPEAMRGLVALMKSKNETVRLRACEAVINRGAGLPPQSLEHTGPGGGPIAHSHRLSALSEEELRTFEVLLAKVQR